ncbi:MAG: hypothetical protein V7641_5403 [Blastocatellia bacterium]
MRQNYEPLKPTKVFNFNRAIRDALAVYYFPGMWEWNREIVLPLAREGFFKSMQQQRDRYVEHGKLTAEEEHEWNDRLELGEIMLNRYFAWAAARDRFSPRSAGILPAIFRLRKTSGRDARAPSR